MTLPLSLALSLAVAAAGAERGGTASAPRVPDAWATRSPDGAWTLILEPASGWSSAEVTVPGGTSVDVGPASQGEPVTVEGAWAPTGVFSVRVVAALDEARGVEWRFDVEPVSVPVVGPQPERRAPRRSLLNRWFRR